MRNAEKGKRNWEVGMRNAEMEGGIGKSECGLRPIGARGLRPGGNAEKEIGKSECENTEKLIAGSILYIKNLRSKNAPER
jgi:hypothetical protein